MIEAGDVGEREREREREREADVLDFEVLISITCHNLN